MEGGSDGPRETSGASAGSSTSSIHPWDSFASKLRLIRKRWEENYAEGRRLRIAYRVAGEAVGAAAVTLAVGYLKNVPGRGTSAGRALFLGGAWAVYYNVLQELIKSQRGIDEWVNSASAGALMGFAVGVPYAGWRKAPVMAFQMGVLATLGRLGGDFLGLGRAFEQSLVQSGLLDEPPSKPPSDARGREWWLLIPGTKALPEEEVLRLEQQGRARVMRPFSRSHGLANVDETKESTEGFFDVSLKPRATVEELLAGLPEDPSKLPKTAAGKQPLK